MVVLDSYAQLKRWHGIRFVGTIGNFDGLHVAHQKLLTTVKRTAQNTGSRSLVITFKNHPHQVGKQKKKPILTSLQHKLFLLQHVNVDFCFVFSFRAALKNLRAEDFLSQILFKKFPLHSLTVGYNFRFGKNRRGTPTLVKQYASQAGIRLAIQDQFRLGGVRVSSTCIRKLISRGELVKAERLLGRKYSVFATAIRGHGRGTSLGFPTANLDVHSEVLPPNGIYVVKVQVWDIRIRRTKKGTSLNEKLIDKNITGVCNLGYAPTFGDIAIPRMEVHMTRYRPNFTGKLLEVTFFKRIRKEKKFKSMNELQQQIGCDIQKARMYFS